MSKEVNIICGIYKITSPSGKIYIGESKNVMKRWNRYKSPSNVKKQCILYNSFLKYTVKKHQFEIVEECSIDELKCRERHWQDFYDVLNREKGLNLILTQCGEVKHIISDETKLKMSIAQSGENNPMYGKFGELNHFYNNTHTEETKNKISKSKLGVASPMKGIPRSKEIRDKQSKTMLKKYADGYINPNTGNILTQEVKDKISEAHKGKKGMSSEKHPLSIKVIEDSTGKVFNSFKEAAKHIGMHKDSFSRQINNKTIKNKTGFSFLDNSILKGSEIRIHKNSKKVLDVETNITYNSITEASKSLKIACNTIMRNIKTVENYKLKLI
jgi:group I intron endonuclease